MLDNAFLCIYVLVSSHDVL